MENKNELAFPTNGYSKGLTKREYFIAQALTGLYGSHQNLRLNADDLKTMIDVVDATMTLMEGESIK